LIVELHVVPIDEITNLLMDVSIGLLGIKTIVGEIRSLRSMSNDVLTNG